MNRKLLAAIAIACIAVGLIGEVADAAQARKIRIGVFSNTCEAPTYVAYKKGFFRNEGLDVELVKGNAKVFKDLLSTGKLDATVGLLTQWIKPMEMGMDIKFTAGLHTGCLHVIVPKDSPIRSVRDLRGKTIATPAFGSGGMLFGMRVLADKHINPMNAVKWRVYPQQEHGLVLSKHQVDAAATADPFATILIKEGKVRDLVNNGTTEPYKNEYCCLLVVRGSLIRKEPRTAAALTRAYLRASEWVNAHKYEAARIESENHYLPGSTELNYSCLQPISYLPSLEGGKRAVLVEARVLKRIGILGDATNPTTLTNHVFVKLPGVNEPKRSAQAIDKQSTGITEKELGTLKKSCCDEGKS